MPRHTLGDVPRLIKERKSFQAASMRGWSIPEGLSATTARYEKGWNQYVQPQAGATYIVYSFDTPIAWIDKFGIARKSPDWFSVRTSRHQGLLYTLKDEPKLKGRKRDRDKANKEFDDLVRKCHADKALHTAEVRREAAQRRYWTPARKQAREARERAKEVASLYGIKSGVAHRAITQTPEEMTIEDAIRSIAGQGVLAR